MLKPVSAPVDPPTVQGAVELIERYASTKINGCLKVISGGVEWRIYFHQGYICHATHSIEPLERLERHSRMLSSEGFHFNDRLKEQLRETFNTYRDSTGDKIETPDYLTVLWLVRQGHLKERQASLLMGALIKEVLHSYLSIGEYKFEFVFYSDEPIARFEIGNLLAETRADLTEWQKLAPHIKSSYQRPYFIERSPVAAALPTEQREKLKKLLIGFNFRQLSVLARQDTLRLARNLHPLVVKGAIAIGEPKPPLDRLPDFSPREIPKVPAVVRGVTLAPVEVQPPITATEEGITYKDDFAARVIEKNNIVCVDDSPAMLKAIAQYLRDQKVHIHTITDPLKALREIVRLEPRLILLDVGMPNLDGYRLCRLIRNHALFKETPIIMVTGNTGMIDRAKAKVAGATDYLTKPFSQSQLETIVQKYL